VLLKIGGSFPFPFYGSVVEDWWLFPVPKSDYDSFLFSKVSSYRSWVLRVTALGSWLGFDLGFSFCRGMYVYIDIGLAGKGKGRR